MCKIIAAHVRYKSLNKFFAVVYQTTAWDDHVLRSLRNANKDGILCIWTLSLHISPEHVFRATGVLKRSRQFQNLLVNYKFILTARPPRCRHLHCWRSLWPRAFPVDVFVEDKNVRKRRLGCTTRPLAIYRPTPGISESGGDLKISWEGFPWESGLYGGSSFILSCR